ncbi:MAG: pyridoxal phosphate-dependent aminotransferase [Lachnospiraceae bacterium]|nr:pyridoxal phosphate-dependent aminotransferase [Lachnospiraceae bacterium]
MKYDFDTVIDRRGTNCLKYDFARERGKREDVLPLWVADMDFKTAPVVLEKLEERVQHGIFGYSEGKEEYFRAVESWYEKRFGWKVKRNWMVKTPGVVFAIAMAVRAFTEEGNGVLIQQPVYYPFSEAILDNRRKLVNNPLKLINGHYEIDFADFEEKIVNEEVKLFLLCSPHNPAGRVWKEWELKKMGDICRKYGVLVVSDEIHSDFVWSGNRHLVFSALSPEYEKITITCTSPSKTFNLAGLQISNIFIPNHELKKRFRQEIAASGYSQLNTLGLTACQAAYEGGEEWLEEVKQYIWENYLFLKEYLGQKIPKIHALDPEGTYLVWLDFRELGLTEQEREDLVVNKAHLWLDSGAMFGKDGEGFERINIACPRKTLEKALKQLEEAL